MLSDFDMFKALLMMLNKNPTAFAAALILCILSPVTGLAADVLELATVREWTSNDGKKLRAQLIDVGPNSYTLKNHHDGRTYDIPIARISDEDRKLVDEANAAIDRAKDVCMTGGGFSGLPDPSEEFWQVAHALGRFRELGELVSGAYQSSMGVIKLTAKNFRRESDKSFLIEGEHVMVRIQVSGDANSLRISGEKLEVVRKTRVTEVRYRGWYGGWTYDSRLKLYSRTICGRKEVYQPEVGAESPCKVTLCALENVGVGRYPVITIAVTLG